MVPKSTSLTIAWRMQDTIASRVAVIACGEMIGMMAVFCSASASAVAMGLQSFL
jgi:hypothetical protein